MVTSTVARFSAIEFLDYFKAKDSLPLKAYQGLSIKNMGFLQVNLYAQSELCSSPQLQKIFNLLNHILSLI